MSTSLGQAEERYVSRSGVTREHRKVLPASCTLCKLAMRNMRNAISTLLFPALLSLSPVASAITLVPSSESGAKVVHQLRPDATSEGATVGRPGVQYDVLERRSIALPNGPLSSRLAQRMIDRAVRDSGGDDYIKISEREEESYTEVVDGVTYPATSLVVDILIIKYR